MPIALLRFKLPEEAVEFQDAQDGGKLKVLVWNLQDWLRRKTKYEDPKLTVEELKVYHEVNNELNQLLTDANIEL